MAERRMFSKSLIDSDDFLDLPQSSQLLYFHLSIRADDEGFVNNPKAIMRNVKAQEDDMRVLIEKKFVISFDSGVIAIRHWKIHNYIQKDRFTPTKYKDERALLSVDDNKVYVRNKATVDSMDTTCIQTVSNLDTQVRLGKVSIDKVNSNILLEEELERARTRDDDAQDLLTLPLRNGVHVFTEKEIQELERLYNGALDVRSEVIACVAYYKGTMSGRSDNWQKVVTRWIARSLQYKNEEKENASKPQRRPNRPALENKEIEGKEGF